MPCLGKTLLDIAAVWAEQHGFAALTLTTSVNVPWNAPYYERLGFQTMAEAEIGAELRVPEAAFKSVPVEPQ